MAMQVAFANNTVMVTMEGVASIISTDPISLGPYDRASAMFSVEYLHVPAGTGTISYQAQVSNDGVRWTNVTALTDLSTTPTTTPLQIIAAINGVYLRFVFTFQLGGASAGDLAAVSFDLHVNLDHA